MGRNASFKGVRLAGRPAGTFWDVSCEDGWIKHIQKHEGESKLDGRIITPGLCHSHIHLDKCFLLSHPKYADLEIEKGDFSEAMELTSKAKARFEHEDLVERGRALIEESISYGITHMRSFVEVDSGVGMVCLEAGIALKREFQGRCFVQICAFAQDPIFSQDDDGTEMCHLMEAAAERDGVDVVGSTPYVEKSPDKQKRNIEWMIRLAQKHNKFLDFHLDYNLDSSTEPAIHFAIGKLKEAKWSNAIAVTLGHCTRLTMFSKSQWETLRNEIGELPISFVGLPTSDLYMMSRVDGENGGGQRNRGTLQIPQMIERYGFNGSIGVNNVGNAFTPHGSCDPLSIAASGVGIYQAGTKKNAELLLECVSSRARAAIGLGQRKGLDLREGDDANFVVFGAAGGVESHGFRHRSSIQELVYDACKERQTVYHGDIVSR